MYYHSVSIPVDNENDVRRADRIVKGFCFKNRLFLDDPFNRATHKEYHFLGAAKFEGYIVNELKKANINVISTEKEEQ